MPRYIDADKLIEYARNQKSRTIGANDIARFPAADVAPVSRGEWVEKTYIHEYANEETEERQYVVCSICGQNPPQYGFGVVNYCHKCGAKMEAKDE